MKKILVVFLIMIIFCLSLVFADGGFFSDYYYHLNAPNQKAAITWDGKTEEMVILSSVKSDDISNIAWVLPIQSSEKPDVEKSNATIFQELVRFFSVQRNSFGKNMLPSEGDAGGVIVIEQKEIDVYDITILKATDSQMLLDWLNNNKYKIPEKTKPILDRYVDKGDMYFIANKLDLRNKFSDEIDKINKFKSRDVIRDTYIFEIGINKFSNVIRQVRDDSYKIDNERLSNWIYSDISQNFNDCEFDYERFENNYLQKYYFLDKEFIENFVDKYKEFIDCNNNKLNGNQWSRIAESFTSKGSNSNLPEDPGIYCHESINGKYEYIVIYSNPEINKKSVNLGFCNYLENQKQFIKDNVEEFYEFHMNNKDEIYDSKKKVDKIIQESDIDYDDFTDLQDTLSKLKRGLGTPLKIDFKPEIPYYPLEISSINQGHEHIEVYVFTNSDIKEKNEILVSTETKKITSDLRKKLAEHINIQDSDYVTRFVFDGELSRLNSDAEFEQSEGVKPDIEPLEYNFLQKFFNWIRELFS
ncbi:DUF2330 domain-containing protein [Candidatus Pacearchaeota archaeon]|nr:DUF2330 domain-containing protein [Candidatus Pacearchaeota archaeon]